MARVRERAFARVPFLAWAPIDGPEGGLIAFTSAARLTDTPMSFSAILQVSPVNQLYLCPW